MIIKMFVKISGTRNGEDWPEAGGTIELPEDEARNLISNGWAMEVPLATIRVATLSAEPAAETATVQKSRKRAVKRS